MSNLTNFHSHCSYCDGKAVAEEFVKSAIAANFVSYGVSSHAPLPFETRWTLKKEKVCDYLNEVNRLKETYKDKIELYVGMEIDYLNDEQNPANSYFQQLPLDYRIGSVHLVYTPDGRIVDTDTTPEKFREILENDFCGDLKLLAGRYFEASMQMVKLGGFDFVGHCDKISYNILQCDPDLLKSDWYKQKLNDYLTLVAEKGLMLEINTKAFSKKGCFFPNEQNFQLIRSLGIPVLVNSDAHLPELVNDGRTEALHALKAAGFETVRQLIGGKWVDAGIEI